MLKLIKEIEQLRQVLHSELKDGIQDSALILRTSQKLDFLITEYYKGFMKKSGKEALYKTAI